MPEIYRIVIVEDDVFLQKLYRSKFESAGFAVAVAGDGEAGLKVIREQLPHVVLLDVDLPKLDGFSVLRQIRAEAATAATPVIMLTNSSRAEAIDLARELQASDYLIKAHFLPSEVLAKVDILIGRTLT